MASSVFTEGKLGAGSLTPIPAALRRPLLIAAAAALVIAGGLISVLSSGSRPAHAIVRTAPNVSGRVTVPSFAGAVPALAVTVPRVRPVVRHRRAVIHRYTAASRASNTNANTNAGVSHAPASTSTPTYTPVTSAPATSRPVLRSSSTPTQHASSSNGGPAFGANGALGPGSSSGS